MPQPEAHKRGMAEAHEAATAEADEAAAAELREAVTWGEYEAVMPAADGAIAGEADEANVPQVDEPITVEADEAAAPQVDEAVRVEVDEAASASTDDAIAAEADKAAAAESSKAVAPEVDEAVAAPANEATTVEADAPAVEALPFQRHPLYLRAEEQLTDGEDEAALGNLRELHELYPGEEAIRDLMLRTQLKSAFVTPEKIPVERRAPTPWVRMIVVFLVIGAVGLAIVAGFVAIYQGPILDRIEASQTAQVQAATLQEALLLLDRGSPAQARDLLQDLADEVPDYPGLQEAMERLREEEAIDALYGEALEAEAQAWQQLEAAVAGDDTQRLEQAISGMEETLVLLDALEARRPGYADVAERAAEVRARIALERDWIGAETLWQAQDWQGVIALLEALRRNAPDFRTDQVEQWLFEAYVLLADQELETAAAQGDVEALKEAIVWLEKALGIFPERRDLREKLSRGRGYIAGAEAFADEAWVEAIEDWQPIYDAQPGYLAGVLEAQLREAYPRAAAALIEAANGQTGPLARAVEYLDRAGVIAPLDEGLVAERDRAAAYVAGAEAYAEGRWDTAISYWGPIYAERQGYQNGALESRLFDACAATESPATDPAATWCP